MNVVDGIVLAFALAMAIWGFQHGLIVGAISLGGFAVGAFAGSRLGPTLLEGGSASPYAPLTALAGGVLIGGIVAIGLESLARRLRERVVRPGGRAAVDGTGGALLLGALGLLIAWILGAVALNTPGLRELRGDIQRSAVLSALNERLPPTGPILNVLNRIDPRQELEGPDARVRAPDAGIARDPDVERAGESVVRVLGTACGLGLSGSGWVAAPGIVVTNAHVIAGQDDTTVVTQSGEEHDAVPIHYEPRNDLAILRVDGLVAEPLQLAGRTPAGEPAAVLGYPENGPFTISPARLGPTEEVISEDSYGRGPVRRLMTVFRGRVRSGNSGGPTVGADGTVLATVFASRLGEGPPGGLGVPNRIVRDAIAAAGEEVSTGACAA